jgi:SAM-dependent methyltransferase
MVFIYPKRYLFILRLFVGYIQVCSSFLVSRQYFLSFSLSFIYHIRVKMSQLSDDFTRKVFFEIHNNLSRQGPGSIQSTLRALHSVNSDDKRLELLDIGCGPGMSTIELARLGHHVTAIDNHEPFIQMLLARAKEEDVSDHITTLLADMFCLEKSVASNIFDVIWSEGCIYIMGFERGLTEWKRFLNKDGFLVCSELSWLTANSPSEAREFWAKNYSGMRSQEENFEIVKKCGYELIDSFVLAENEWWDEYYGPMEKRIQELKMKYQGQREAEIVLDEQQSEIDLYKKYSKSYGYVFYIMKK